MKKLIICAAIALAGIVAQAVEPFVVIKTEFWGKKYAILTDVNGYTYKFDPPTNGQKVRLATRTGWYLVDGTGTIISYKDPK